MCEWLRLVLPSYHLYVSPSLLPCRDVNRLYNANKSELDALPATQRERRLVELHVWAQTQVLLSRPEIIKAQQGGALQVHGFVYDGARDKCVDLVR
jgi:carbonic anhydrase